MFISSRKGQKLPFFITFSRRENAKKTFCFIFAPSFLFFRWRWNARPTQPCVFYCIASPVAREPRVGLLCCVCCGCGFVWMCVCYALVGVIFCFVGVLCVCGRKKEKSEKQRKCVYVVCLCICVCERQRMQARDTFFWILSRASFPFYDTSALSHKPNKHRHPPVHTQAHTHAHVHTQHTRTHRHTTRD
jgi:hypothetical protein